MRFDALGEKGGNNTNSGVRREREGTEREHRGCCLGERRPMHSEWNCNEVAAARSYIVADREAS